MASALVPAPEANMMSECVMKPKVERKCQNQENVNDPFVRAQSARGKTVTLKRYFLIAGFFRFLTASLQNLLSTYTFRPVLLR